MTVVEVQAQIKQSVEIASDPVPYAWTIDQYYKAYAYDRGRKLRDYARAGISEYWILNLIDRRLEIYREPAGDEGYRLMRLALDGEGVRTSPPPPLLGKERGVSPLEVPASVVRGNEMLPWTG